MKYYTIYFTGETLENVNTEQLKENLCMLFKTDLSRIEKMFTGKPVIVKKSISGKQVKKYQQALFKAGARIVVKEEVKETLDKSNHPVVNRSEVNNSVVNQEQPKDNDSNHQLNSGLAGLINYNQTNESQAVDAQHEEQDKLTLCLPNTGSLEEFAAKKEEFVEPDFSDYSLSEPNSGSLEEYVPKVIADEIKDISYMDITDQNDRPLSDQTEKPKPVELPDISNITMSEPNSGDLQKFVTPVKATKIKDISSLKLVNNS